RRGGLGADGERRAVGREARGERRGAHVPQVLGAGRGRQRHPRRRHAGPHGGGRLDPVRAGSRDPCAPGNARPLWRAPVPALRLPGLVQPDAGRCRVHAGARDARAGRRLVQHGLPRHRPGADRADAGELPQRVHLGADEAEPVRRARAVPRRVHGRLAGGEVRVSAAGPGWAGRRMTVLAPGLRVWRRALAAALPLSLLAVLPARAAAQPRNVILILSDDHRYDFMGFMPGAPEWLETPALDRMAAEGAHLANAFVTTSLCSPSRASILTGQYAHRHRVVDNTSGIPEGTVFFPVPPHGAGWRTAHLGRWPRREDVDDPRPGCDHRVRFLGQGVYEAPELNVAGKRRVFEGYTTDLLTKLATDWLEQRRRDRDDRPFFLVPAHKAVHAEFVPAPRHRGRYAEVEIPYPVTMPKTESNLRGQPRWVRAQRTSWHGVDYAYHGQ